jgi:hypothetical protein
MRGSHPKRIANARKGQAEFVVIIILIAIGVATVSYAVFTSSPELLQGTQEPKTVKDTIFGFISEAGYDTLQTMGLYGGYLGPQENYAFFERQQGIPVVNYYYYEGETYYPTAQELEANLVLGVSDYIRRYKDSVEKGLESQGVEIGDEFSVQAKIHENKVVLTVDMPTAVKNQTIPQPYEVELITRFGEIYEFGKGLAELNGKERFFETFTLAEMASSPVKSGEKSVLLFVPPQFDCEPVYIGWNEMKKRVEDSITRMIQHTRISGDKRNGARYIFPPVNGRGGETLKVGFFAPASFSLGKDDFNFKTTPDNVINAIKVDPKPIDYLPERCYSDPMFVTYNIRYPLIVVIEDDVTRDSFRFALDIVVKGYDLEAETTKDGDMDFDAGTKNEMCQNMKCKAIVNVKDNAGKQLSYAPVSFGGCPLGETDENGVFNGDSPCILGMLEVSKVGYVPHSEFQSIDKLEQGVEVKLFKEVKTTFYVHVVSVRKESGNYTINPSETRYLSGETAQLFISKSGKTIDYEPFITGKMKVFDMDPGIYTGFSSLLFSSEDKTKTLGGFVLGKTTYIIVSDEKNAFHVYIPRAVGFEVEEYGGFEALYHVVDRCGYGPVLETEAIVSGKCSIPIKEVEGE